MGQAIRVTSWPATSSMTMCEGSFVLQPRASSVAAGIPIAVTTTISTSITGTRAAAGSCDANAHQSSTAASEPHVPGPGRNRPAPKKVATNVAQAGAVLDVAAASVGFFDMIVGVAGIVGLRIVERTRNHITAARPLAEVNQAAALAAERELGNAAENNPPADGTSQAGNTLLFPGHRSTYRMRATRSYSCASVISHRQNSPSRGSLCSPKSLTYTVPSISGACIAVRPCQSISVSSEVPSSSKWNCWPMSVRFFLRLISFWIDINFLRRRSTSFAATFASRANEVEPSSSE